MRRLVTAIAVVTSCIAADLGASGNRVEKEHFICWVSSPKLESVVDSSLDAARKTLAILLHDTLDYKPDVHVVDLQSAFDSLVTGKFPDWGAAAAIPVWRRIVVKSPYAFSVRRPLPELLAHEYSHLALASRTGFYSAPRWFDEGLAMKVSQEWSWSDNLAMSKAAVFRQLLSLDTIEFVNRFGEGPAHVAYATSFLAVTYFYKQYGDDAANLFLDSIARGATIDAALVASTGSNYRDFEKEFRVYLESRFNTASLFADTMYFWLALALVLVLGAYLQWRRRRFYYKKWEREDRYESKDFDYGDPKNAEKIDRDEFDDIDDNEDEPWRS